MKRTRIITAGVGLLLMIIGIVQTILTKEAALVSNAAKASTIAFAISLIIALSDL